MSTYRQFPHHLSFFRVNHRLQMGSVPKGIQNLGVFFVVGLSKSLSKHSGCWWFQMSIIDWIIGNTFPWNLHQQRKFTQENEYENVVCKMADIFSRHPCVQVWWAGKEPCILIFPFRDSKSTKQYVTEASVSTHDALCGLTSLNRLRKKL